MSSPEPVPPMNLHMAARWWASKNIPVLPLNYPTNGACSCGDATCGSVGKHPMGHLVRHGLEDATTELGVIDRWWTREPYANIGVRTGEVFDLLDLDSAEGVATYDRIVTELGGAPQHLGTALSGRDGIGMHLYVVPGGHKALAGGKSSPEGIDVKGQAGYAVAPPSLHASGRPYHWMSNHFDSGEVSGTVDWSTFYTALRTRPDPKPAPPAALAAPRVALTGDAATAYGRAVLTRAISLVDHAVSGHRWSVLATEAIPLVARGIAGGCIDRDPAVADLEDAARRIGLTDSEAQRISGLVDGMIDAGITHPIRPKDRAAAVDAAVEPPQYDTEEEAREDPWEPPWPLRYPTPSFPTEVFGWMEPAIVGLASHLQVPVDLVAMMSLAAVAATVRGRIRAAVTTGWEEPLNLYVAAVLGPGETKSPALSRILAPLRRMEERAREVTTAQIAQATFEKDIADERARKSRDRAVKASGDEALMARHEAWQAQAEAEAIVVPTPPLYLAGDMTPEALVSKLAEQNGTLAHISAEGELIDTIVGGRYSGGTPHLSALLTAHDGREPVRVHRKRDADIEVARPCLTLGLAVQPQVLEQMGGSDVAVRRGLAARFLYSIPSSLVGRRSMAVRDEFEQSEMFTDLVEGVETIASRSGGSGDFGHTIRGSEETNGTETPGVLGISGTKSYKYGFEDPSLLLVTYYREGLEPRRAAQTGDLGEISPWANKLDGHVVRLAALLQLVHDAERVHTTPDRVPKIPESIGSVGPDATANALLLGDYLIAHAIEAHALMSGDDPAGDHSPARQLLGWVKQHAHTEFSAHDAERSLRRRVTFREQGSVLGACTTLERLGWLRRIPQPEGKPGRPSTRYLVHPEAHR